MPQSLTSSEKARAARLRRLFDLSLEDYDTILEYQGGVCFVCEKPPKEGGNRLGVDHNHETGLVRGLLCWNCNGHVIAKHKDSRRLHRGAEYLDNPPATLALGREAFGVVGRVTTKAKNRRKKA